MTEHIRVPDKYEEQKHCCTVCAAKRRCSVCDEQTTLACSDCAIDLRAVVYVCKKTECRDHHETKCAHTLIERIAKAEAARDDFERKGKDLCQAYGTSLITIHDLQQERDALKAQVARLSAYREWLRDGFRAIARGSLDEAAKDDKYVRYAKDCLSGPTEEILYTLIAARKESA